MVADSFHKLSEKLVMVFAWFPLTISPKDAPFLYYNSSSKKIET